MTLYTEVGKSPISVLQELAAAKKISLPEYSVTQVLAGFKCELKLGDISVHATASSKKFAKHLCAVEVLERLQQLQCSSKYDEGNSKASCSQDDCAGPSTKEDCPGSSKASPAKDDIDVSSKSSPKDGSAYPVMKLNELCVQKKIELPVFIELGMNGDGTFTFVCNCLTYTTLGTSRTKKHAKHIAAAEMLNKIEFSSPSPALPVLVMPPAPAEIDEEVDTSVTTKVDLVFKNMDIEFRRLGINGHSKSTGQCLDKKSKKVEHKDTYQQDLLVAQLLSFGYSYYLHTLQELPLILALKATNSEDGDEQTFVRMCETENAGLIELLQLAVRVIKILRA